MPTKSDQIQQVINQMLKGPRHGRADANKQQITVFHRRHEDKVRWVLSRTPKHYSAAVAAVLTKALIFYGPEKVDQFTTALRKLVFKGPEDPAHLLWLFLLKPKGKENTPDVYRKTVNAVKAYMEGRTLQKLTAVQKDIFDWDEYFTLPDGLVEQNELVEQKIKGSVS